MELMYHYNSASLHRRVFLLIVAAIVTGYILYYNEQKAFNFLITECKDNMTKLRGHLPPPYKVNPIVTNFTKIRIRKIKYAKYCYVDVSTSASLCTPSDVNKFTDVAFSNVSEEMKYLGFGEYGDCDGDRRIAAPFIPTIISAVSRNHYGELAALCKNMNTTLRRRIPKINFIIYNLETSQNSDAKALAHYCGSEIRDFPFSRFPRHVRLLTGYTWKPLVISMALREFPFVMWLDASIRFNPRKNITRLWERARTCHIQMLSAPCCSVAEVTDTPTMRFLKQNESEYMGTSGIGAGFGIFLRTKILMESVIRPWVLCAMSYGCMLTDKYKHQTPCYKQKPMKAAVCHRFEQAVLAIILSKLYESNYVKLLVKEREFGSVARGNTIRYQPLKLKPFDRKLVTLPAGLKWVKHQVGAGSIRGLKHRANAGSISGLKHQAGAGSIRELKHQAGAGSIKKLKHQAGAGSIKELKLQAGAGSTRGLKRQMNVGSISGLKHQAGAGSIRELKRQAGAGSIGGQKHQAGAGSIRRLKRQAGAGSIRGLKRQAGAGSIRKLKRQTGAGSIRGLKHQADAGLIGGLKHQAGVGSMK